MSIAIIERLWANTSPTTIAVKILGAAEGFLPKAFMLAYIPAANTAEGPIIHNPKIIMSAKFLLIF